MCDLGELTQSQKAPFIFFHKNQSMKENKRSLLHKLIKRQACQAVFIVLACNKMISARVRSVRNDVRITNSTL